MKEVYVKIGEELTEDSMIEFNEFWKTHENDNEYVMFYVDENNRIVQ